MSSVETWGVGEWRAALALVAGSLLAGDRSPELHDAEYKARLQTMFMDIQVRLHEVKEVERNHRLARRLESMTRKYGQAPDIQGGA